MTGSPGGGAPQRDSVSESVVFAVGLLLAPILLWLTAHAAISEFVMSLRSLEAYLVPYDPAAQVAIRHWSAHAAASNVTLDQLANSGSILGDGLRWGVVGFLALLAAFLLYRSPEWPGRFTQRYTMDSLARQESSLWPTITPVLGLGLVDVPIDDPVQGMRMLPRDYGYKYKFIEKAATLKTFPDDAETINPREVLLVGRAREVFTKQLGRRWTGIDSLQPHEKALFAAFAAQANYDADAAQQLIDTLPKHYLKAVKAKNPKLITTPSVVPLLAKYGDTDVVKQVLKRHHYVRTVLMALLMAARKNGILPPGWFRWLKTVDRITWYALNDLGTENASIEAGGVRCHYNAERLIRAPMDAPEVEAAIDGLRDYLQEILDENPEAD
ncbi:MAG: type IVB secretion system coupling complex protein DotM/IcmP [Rhodanobacter sp.]